MNEKIFFWPGDDCNVNEKMKGLEVATNMRKGERHGDAVVLFPKENDEVDKEFWGHLGGKPKKINPYEPDEAEVPEEECEYHFFKISNADGKLNCHEI